MSTFGESTIREFIGWLSVDIKELHNVEMPRMAESWDRFKARKRLVEPWGTWQERCELARSVKAGDRWVQIKSGRVATVLSALQSNGCIGLKHENGNKTQKWRSYFGQEFTPETPPTLLSTEKP